MTYFDLYYSTTLQLICYHNHFMPWQSAARGGFLRTLHRGALSPRTGVSDLQDQLRRVSLTASSDLARPQVQLLSSTQSIFQSNSFATASTPLKASKTPKAKSSKKAGSEAKKPLSEKQKEIEEIKQRRAHIRELKATALLSGRPKRLPNNAFAIAMSELLPQTSGYSSHKEAFVATVERVKSIGPQDEEVCALRFSVYVRSGILIPKSRDSKLKPRRTWPLTPLLTTRGLSRTPPSGSRRPTLPA